MTQLTVTDDWDDFLIKGLSAVSSARPILALEACRRCGEPVRNDLRITERDRQNFVILMECVRRMFVKHGVENMIFEGIVSKLISEEEIKRIAEIYDFTLSELTN